MNVSQKRDKEKETIKFMIELYSRHKHIDCQELLDYALKRIDCCPFMENKTFCSQCKVHCYQPKYREQIKEVMRYSGPRMLFYHPVMAIKHIYYTISSKIGKS